MNTSKYVKTSAALAVVLMFLWEAGGQTFGGYESTFISGTPHDVIYDDARQLAYVSNRSSNRIDVISMETRGIVRSIATGKTPTGMTLTPEGNRLLVAYSDDYQLGVINLDTFSVLRTIALPQNVGYNPYRVDCDAAGTIFWRDATKANPYGHIYTLNLDTGVSTLMFSGQPTARYAFNDDRNKALIMYECDHASIWDAQTQSTGLPEYVPGFSYGNGGWITQGALNNAGTVLLMTRAGESARVYDSSLAFLGATSGMAWGTMGDWPNVAIMAESRWNESVSDQLFIFDTSDLSIKDTLKLPENIGWGEYDFGNRPMELTPDGDTLLVVGSSQLFFVDTSQVPEPSILSLLALGGLALFKRRRT